MLNLLKWYFNLDKFTNTEIEILNDISLDNPMESDKYLDLENEYFKRMPLCNINNKDYHITFEYKARTFINYIFSEYFDDTDTLIISVENEHHSVLENINKCKNGIILKRFDVFNYNFSKIMLELSTKKYKRAFVYITGVQLFTGEIIPQLFFEKLKDILLKNNISVKMMLDDVHGMFLIPRDYSIFDYILYTAHSIVDKFDMGLLISKDGLYGKRAYNWGSKYLKRLDIMLKRKEKIFLFKYILNQYFNQYFSNKEIFSEYKNTVNHIYSISYRNLYFSDKDCEYLKENGILINKDIQCIRFRIKEFFNFNTDEVINKLSIFTKILDKAILIKKMKEG